MQIKVDIGLNILNSGPTNLSAMSVQNDHQSHQDAVRPWKIWTLIASLFILLGVGEVKMISPSKFQFLGIESCY